MSKAVEVRTAKELCLKEQPTQKLQTVHANEKSGEVSWANISGDHSKTAYQHLLKTTQICGDWF